MSNLIGKLSTFLIYKLMNKLISLAIGVLLSNIADPVAVSAKQERFIQTTQDRISVNSKITSRTRKNKKSRYLYYHFRKSIEVVDSQTKTFCKYVHFSDNTNFLYKGVLLDKNTRLIENIAVYRPEEPERYEVKNNLKQKEEVGENDYRDEDSVNENDELALCTKAGGFQRTYKKIITPKSN